MRRTVTPEQFRRLSLAALLSLAAIIVTGALVRLTGSGLGCSDWPTCEEDELVAEFSFHPLVEFGNRLITGVVSVAVIAAVLAATRREPRRRDLTVLAWGLVAGVVAQILLGALVTRTELDPRVVLGHFLLSMVLVANATALHHRAALPDPPPPPARHPARRRDLALVVGTATVIVIGTMVTGSGPHTGSLDEPIERLPFALRDIVRVHSLAAWGLLALVAATAMALARRGRPADRRRIELVLALVVAQGAVGYLQYATDVPIGLVAVHIVGVVALWWAVLSFVLHRRHPTAAPTPRAVAVA